VRGLCWARWVPQFVLSDAFLCGTGESDSLFSVIQFVAETRRGDRIFVKLKRVSFLNCRTTEVRSGFEVEIEMVSKQSGGRQ